MANKIIRDELKARRVRHWELAQELGISEVAPGLAIKMRHTHTWQVCRTNYIISYPKAYCNDTTSLSLT